MATISTTNALVLLDQIAAGRVAVDTMLGTGVEAGTLSLAAANIEAAVLALDSRDQELALLQAAANLADGTTTAVMFDTNSTLKAFFTALQSHVGGNIGTFLSDDDKQMHWAAALAYYNSFNTRIAAAAVFSPIVELGTWLSSGSGTGSFSDGSAMDTTLYAPAQLEAYIPAGVTIGNATLGLLVSCKTAAGATEIKTIAIPNGSVAGATVDIGTSINLYWDITTVTATLGAVSDQVKFRNKQPRTVNVT